MAQKARATPKRAIAGLVLTAFVLCAAGLTLGGCDDAKIAEWLDTKKKLPGDRKEVFPGGVPGVQQGVPSELTKGYQEQQQKQQQQAEAAAAAAAAEEAQKKTDEARQAEAKPRPKPKPKPKRVAQPSRAPAAQQQPAPPPAAAATQPWPTQNQAQQTPPPAQENGLARWPDASQQLGPPSDHFQR